MRRGWGRAPVWLLAGLVALAGLLPLGFVVVSTVGVGWDTVVRLVVRPRVGELLWNTVRLAGGAMALSLAIGIGAAWLVERSTVPFRRGWHVLLLAPLAVPSFVNSFGWVSLPIAVDSYWAALLIVTLSYYPLVYLPVVAALRGLDGSLEETAGAAGLGPGATFARVVLPQLRVAALGGALLVGLHLLAEFGALQMLRYPTFTTAIYDAYRSTFNGPAATMLASVLVLLCLVLLVGELRLRGAARYARLGSGVPRPARRARLGRATPLAVLALAVLVVLALGVPLTSLGYWLVEGSSTAFPVGTLVATAATTLGLGAAAALITVAAALPVAWLYVRRRTTASMLVERSTYVASALPGIVVALALITVAIRFVPAVYQQVPLLLVAYAVLFVPRAMVPLRAALAQAPPVLDDVSHALGAGRLQTLRRVTLPLVLPGLGAGAALVFLAVVTELTATLLLAPTGTATLATQFWSSTSSLEYGAAAPYAALMVLLSAPAVHVLTRHQGAGAAE